MKQKSFRRNFTIIILVGIDQMPQEDRAKDALSIGLKRHFFRHLLKEKSTKLTTFGMP